MYTLEKNLCSYVDENKNSTSPNQTFKSDQTEHNTLKRQYLFSCKRDMKEMFWWK